MPKPVALDQSAKCVVLDNVVGDDTTDSNLSLGSKSIWFRLGIPPEMVQEILSHNDSEDGSNMRAVLIRTETMRRSIIDNDAYFERRSLLKDFQKCMMLGSGDSVHHSVKLAASGSVQQQALSGEHETTEPPRAQMCERTCMPESTERTKSTSLELTKRQQREQHALLTGCSSAIIPKESLSLHGDLVEQAAQEEKEQQQLCHSLAKVKCYGAAGNVWDGWASPVKGHDLQDATRYSTIMGGSVCGVKGGNVGGITTSSSATAIAAGELEELVINDVVVQSWFGRNTRHLVLHGLMAGIIGLVMLRISLCSSMNLFVRVKDSIPRQNSIRFSFAVIHAVICTVFIPLVATSFRGMRAMPHIMLVIATCITVGGTFLLMYGYVNGDFRLLLLEQVVHGVGLSVCIVSLLLFFCVETGAELGIPSFMFFVLHIWMGCNVLGFFVFPGIAGSSSGDTGEVMHVFFLATCAGPLLALGVCSLLQPTTCQRSFNILRYALSPHGLLTGVRDLKLCCVLRALACTCLFSGLCLLTIGGETLRVLPLSSTSATVTRIDGKRVTPLGFTPGQTCLLFLSATVAFPLCLIPFLAPVVRLGESGLAAAATTLALAVFLIPEAATFSLRAATMCGVSLALTLAGLFRSLAAAPSGSSEKALTVLFAFLLAVCIVFAESVAAGLMGYRMQHIETSGDVAVTEMQRRDIWCVSLAMCSVAIVLQVVAAFLSLHTYSVHRYEGD